MNKLIFSVALWLATFAAHAGNYTDVWYTPSESGWGIAITQKGADLFAAWYHYDPDGKNTWFTVQGARISGNAASGTIFRTSGPPFSAEPFNSSQVSASAVGTATFRFLDANTIDYSWSIGAANFTKRIVRLPFGNRPDADAFNDLSDIYYNPNEAGWGISVTQHGDNIFAAWYTYGADRRPMWIIAPGGTLTIEGGLIARFTGDLYRTSGTGYDKPLFNSAGVVATKVGSLTLEWNGRCKAEMRYTLDGVTQQKEIQRLEFGGEGPLCARDPKANTYSLPAGVTVSGPISGGAGDGLVDLSLPLQNNTDQAVTVTLPAGLVFLHNGRKAQNGILIQSLVIAIPARSTVTTTLRTQCLNLSRDQAKSADTYTIGGVTTEPGLIEIATLVRGKDSSGQLYDAVVQTAVWQVTDGFGLTEDVRAQLRNL